MDRVKKLEEAIMNMPQHVDNQGQPLPAKSVAEVRLMISRSRRREELYWDTCRDAAILAAQQVQDKRIELLEKPPEVSFTDIICDILIGVTLSLPVAAIAGGVTKAVMKKLIGPSLKTREVVKVFSAELRQKQFIGPGVLKSTVIKIKEKELGGDAIQGRKLSPFLEGAIDESIISSIGLTGQKLVDAAKNKIAASADSQTGGDTPGVAMSSAAMDWANRQKQVTNITHDILDILVGSGLIKDGDTLEEISQLMKKNLNKWPEDGEVEQLRLLWEAAIWVSILGPIKETMFRKSGRMYGGVWVYKYHFNGAPPNQDLISYWQNRFKLFLEKQDTDTLLDFLYKVQVQMGAYFFLKHVAFVIKKSALIGNPKMESD